MSPNPEGQYSNTSRPAIASDYKDSRPVGVIVVPLPELRAGDGCTSGSDALILMCMRNDRYWPRDEVAEKVSLINEPLAAPDGMVALNREKPLYEQCARSFPG